jgi:hypothetical protein
MKNWRSMSYSIIIIWTEGIMEKFGVAYIRETREDFWTCLRWVWSMRKMDEMQPLVDILIKTRWNLMKILFEGEKLLQIEKDIVINSFLRLCCFDRTQLCRLIHAWGIWFQLSQLVVACYWEVQKHLFNLCCMSKT